MPDRATPSHVVFETTPVTGVPLEVIRFLLALPDEVRVGLGNFLLDSTVDGFDGTPETSERLWKDELRRRIEDARACPESCLTVGEAMREVRERLGRKP